MPQAGERDRGTNMQLHESFRVTYENAWPETVAHLVVARAAAAQRSCMHLLDVHAALQRGHRFKERCLQCQLMYAGTATKIDNHLSCDSARDDRCSTTLCLASTSNYWKAEFETFLQASCWNSARSAAPAWWHRKPAALFTPASARSERVLGQDYQGRRSYLHQQTSVYPTPCTIGRQVRSQKQRRNAAPVVRP